MFFTGYTHNQDMNSKVSRPKKMGQFLSFNEFIGGGLEVIDHIERRRCHIKTPGETNLTHISTENFHFPVDNGVAITTDELSLPYSVAAYIRNHAGYMIDQLTSGNAQDFPSDQYSIELSAPIKLYIKVNCRFEISVESDHIKIKFQDRTRVSIGARSHHERPATKIITPPNPEKMMESVSCLSSALKTTTCERSYPTLRGHPPEIELGDELQVPAILEKPETGIEIEIPPDHQSIYVFAPLAYYFGASIVPGESHILKTSHGYDYDFSSSKYGVEQEAERVLKQCFFLDCLVRTEGYYNIRLYEREQLEQHLNIDFSVLYDQPLPNQIEEYLNVEYDMIEPYFPQWKQTAHVEADPVNVEVIPFLIHDLAVIHSTKNTETVRSKINTGFSEEDRNRDHPSSSVLDQINKSDKTRSRTCIKRSSEGVKTEPDKHIKVPKLNSTEQTWVGDGIPIGASKSMTTAFKNRLKRDPTEEDIEISVVVNDSEMVQEGVVVDDIYGSREQLSLSVEIHHQLSVDELHDLLQKKAEFLHYVGHIDQEGFQCSDGKLDATNIERVGIDSFFLNACSSYQQAIALINAGSIAGIATVKPILNSGAERVGKAIARLLNLGFPLVAALNIARSKSIMGDNYVIIGDSGLDLTQPKSGIPSSCNIERKNSGFNIKYNTYLTRRKNIGSITIPYAKNNKQFYLTSGKTGEFSMRDDEAIRFLSEEKLPIKLDSKLYWSDEITTEELFK